MSAKEEEKKYNIWYKTRIHCRHKTESLTGTWAQLLNRLTEMALDGKMILAIGENGVFKPYRLSTGEL
jgi:hypothetical protein